MEALSNRSSATASAASARAQPSHGGAAASAAASAEPDREDIYSGALANLLAMGFDERVRRKPRRCDIFGQIISSRLTWSLCPYPRRQSMLWTGMA